MENTFYIYYRKETEDRTWYMVLLKSSHFCLSASSDLEALLEGLKKTYKKYRTKGALFRALQEMEYPAKVPESVFNERSAWYAEHGEEFDGLIKSTIEEAREEAREEDIRNSKYNKTKKRLKPLLKKDYTTTTETTKEVSEVSPHKSTTSPGMKTRRPLVRKVSLLLN